MDEREELEKEGVRPELMEFLEAESIENKLEVLRRVRDSLDDNLINSMAASCDLVVREGSLDKRIEELNDCLRMKARFEINRFR